MIIRSKRNIILLSDIFKGIRNATNQFSRTSTTGAAYPANSFVPFEINSPETSVIDPAEHTDDHLGLWYTVDKDVATRLYGSLDHRQKPTTTHQIELPIRYMEISDAIGKHSFMIRKPAFTVIDYIKRSNLSLPPNKFIFYGPEGCGKSLSLGHVLHYLSTQGWFVVHLAWPYYWRTRFHNYRTLVQLAPSPKYPGLIDTPYIGSIWLRQFKIQNAELLSNPDLTTIDTHEWSKRESLPAGSSLTELIDQGLARSKNTCSVIYALISELKKNATAGNIKAALVIDGVNSLYRDNVEKKMNYQKVNANDFTLHEAFKQMLLPDWNNGAVVGTVCERANDEDLRESYLPRYLLQKNGWEGLDPFIPIEVPLYSESEITSAINFLVKNKWIHHPMINTVMGRKEIDVVTGRNAARLMEFVEPL